MEWEKVLKSTGLTNYNHFFLFSLLKISTFLALFFNFSGIRTGDAKDIAAGITFFIGLICLIIHNHQSAIKTPLFYFMVIYLIVSYLLLPLSAIPPASFKYLGKEVLAGFSLFLGIYLIIAVNSSDKIDKPPNFTPILTALAIILFVL